MPVTEIVCLCQQYDIRGIFGAGFVTDTPGLKLVLPDEVSDPEGIRYALAFRPADDGFDAYPNLKMIACPGAGADALLVHPRLPEGAWLTRMTDAAQAQALSGFAIWHIIGWQRQMQRYAASQRQRLWQEEPRVLNHEFPVAVLGYGNIGRTLAQALAGLGFPVTAYASSARQDGQVRIVAGEAGLGEIAQGARAVVNLLALTGETRGILSRSFFEAMREDAILIQLGRGDHMIEEDLLAGLAAGRPAHAALDVTAVEPLPPDHPFWDHPQVTLTPHIAGDADPKSVATAVAENIRRIEAGETPTGVVNRQRGY